VKTSNRLYHLLGYILLTIVIYYTVDFESFTVNLKQVSLPAILVLLILATADRFTMAFKWMHLCTALNLDPKFSRFLKIYYVASFLGYCLPTTLGGEAYKAARLSRYEDGHKVFASMFMEKIIGVFSTVFFAWAGSIYISFSLPNENSALLLYGLLGLTTLAVGATWASLHTGLQSIIIKISSRFRIGKTLEKLTVAYSSLNPPYNLASCME
jgi:uncharacterized membrane protein YbhN (UPF0104 family)